MKRRIVIVIIALIIFIFAILSFFLYEPAGVYNSGNEEWQNLDNKNQEDKPITDLFKPKESTARNFDWSNGKCKGAKGTVPLTASPMNQEDILYIYPYGTIDPWSGHVTPIDHQYYYPKNREQGPDLYDIFAPADGYIVSVSKRNQFVSEEGGANPVPDYYIIMEHSCSFWTYIDLATSLSSEIQEQVGDLADDEVFVTKEVRIPIKGGQKLGKIGLRSLDFGVYDSETNLPGFLVYEHYDGEPWKVHTVDPYDFFIEPIRSELIAKTLRKTEPIGGKIDYDIDGKIIGNWFVEGSGGFPIRYEEKNWRNHLAIIPDAFDPSLFIFSHGDINGKAQAFGIKNKLDFAQIGEEAGLIKLELYNYDYFRGSSDRPWGEKKDYIPDISARIANEFKGTALLQMINNRKIKVEVFMGKTPVQVSGFSSNAQIYER